MANEINSVAGQLVGIPIGQVYTAGPGIKIDNVHKTVSVNNDVTNITTLSDIGTKTVNNTNWNGTYAIVANNWVNLCCKFDPNAAQTVNNGTTVFTVKAELRPAVSVRANFVVTNAAGRGIMTLNTDGTIVMGENNGVAANNMYARTFNFIYPLATA